MKSLLVFICVLFIYMSSLTQQDLTGIWTGKLELPNSIKLTIVFNLTKNTEGNYISTLDSPDQGAMGIQTESTTINNDSILIKIPVVKGFYSGKIFYDEMRIEGKWS